MALPILGAAGLTALNGLLDTSAVERPGSGHMTFGRPPGYEVDVPWWRADRAKPLPDEVRIDAPEAASCVRNVIVVTGDGRLGSDWLRGIRCAPPTQDEALKLEHVGVGPRHKSPYRELLFDVRLRNDHDEPRWILMPTLATSASASLSLTSQGTFDLKLERRGAILIAHLHRSQQRFVAVFMPPHTGVKLDALPFAHAYSAPFPKLIEINAVVARRLTFDGKPGEEWLSADPLPATTVMLEGSTLASRYNAALLEIGEERSIYSEVILDR